MSVRRLALLAIILTAFLWGSGGTTAKLLLLEANPFVLLAYRFSLAALLVLPAFLMSSKPKGWLLRLLPLGIFNAANVLFYFTGLTYTTANTGSLLGAGVPILTALLSFLLIGETVSRQKLFGILLGLAGAAAIILVPVIEGTRAIGTSLTGNLLMAGSAVSWTLYIIRARSVSQDDGFRPAVATFVNFASCAVAALGFCTLTGQRLILPGLASPGYAALFVYLTVGVTVVTFFLFQWAVTYVSATTASLKEYLQLVVGVTLNTIILGEQLTPVFLAGSALVLTGVVIATGERLSRKIVSLFAFRSQ